MSWLHIYLHMIKNNIYLYTDGKSMFYTNGKRGMKMSLSHESLKEE